MFDRCKLELSQGKTSITVIVYKVIAGSYKEGGTLSGRVSVPDPRTGHEWELVLPRCQLKLFDPRGPGTGMTGGKNGELTPLDPIAILNLAYPTTRGIEPINPSGIGSGTIMNGFSLSVRFTRGPVSWRLSAFQHAGSHDWMEL